MTDCLFCNFVSGAIKPDVVLETDTVLAFRDIHPQASTHVLIVPKQHIATIDDLQPEHAELMGQTHVAAKPVAAAQRKGRVRDPGGPGFFRPGRDSSKDGAPVGRDHLAEPITLRKGLTGAKPQRFCSWALDLMGYVEGDTVDDDGRGALAPSPYDAPAYVPDDLGHAVHVVHVVEGDEGVAAALAGTARAVERENGLDDVEAAVPVEVPGAARPEVPRHAHAEAVEVDQP